MQTIKPYLYMNDTALRQDTQSEAPSHKSLFATLDETGTPVHLRPCIDWERNPQIDRAFEGYVREEVHINNIRAPVPDYRLCRYDFDDDAPLHRFSWADPDADTLARFIDKHGGQLREEYSLIAAMTVFLCFSDMPGHSEMDILRRTYDSRRPDAELHERIEQCVISHREQLQQPMHQRGVIVDTTPRGSIVLEHTGYGNRCHRGYLQYLADHYFDPDHKDITSLETWVIRGCSPQLHALGVESRRMFGLPDFTLIPERLDYRQCTLEGEPPTQEMYRLPLGHNSKDFRTFIDRYNLSISDRNIDICALLSIVESGSARSVRNNAVRMLKESFGVDVKIPERIKQHKPSLH